jgi:hypothetical protein
MTRSNLVKVFTKRFEVLEDSQPQRSFFGAESTPFARLSLDTSAVWKAVSFFAVGGSAVVERLRTDDVVAVYQFDSEVVKLQDFTSSSDLRKVFKLRPGMTVLYDAIATAAQEL